MYWAFIVLHVTKNQSIVDDRRKFESVFSKKVRAGKRRTYFFDVRQTRGEDYYLTITESTRRFNSDGYERHKIFLYKEDFNRFLTGMTETIDHIKHELMPDYDYDEYTRRHEEYEARRAAGEFDNPRPPVDKEVTEAKVEVEETIAEVSAPQEMDVPEETDFPIDDIANSDDSEPLDEDDMKW